MKSGASLVQIAGDHWMNYFLRNIREFPDKIAFINLENGEDAERKISYGDLESGVIKLVLQLSNEQLEGKRVLLMYQDTLEFIISFLACTYSGIIPVPVSYIKGKKQISRLINIIEDAGADAIFCNQSSVAHLQEGLAGFAGADNLRIVFTDITQLSDQKTPKPLYNEVGFIQYTSGSTDRPKGVIITCGNLLQNQQSITNTFGCHLDSVIFSWLPFHHDMGLIGNILHTIYTGCTCVLMSPFHFMQKPKRWLEGISKYKATHSGGPNFSYDVCVDKIPAHELDNLDLSSWIVAYNGSEPVRADTIKRFTDHFAFAGFMPASFFPCYGLAEATLLVSGNKNNTAPVVIAIDDEPGHTTTGSLAEGVNEKKRFLVSSGAIASGISVKIISGSNQKECKDLEEGEIYISGDNVTNGYWNKDNKDLFREVEGKKFLGTGDAGFKYKGELFISGRLKEMLIIRGKNVYPYDIEKAASESDMAIESNGVALFSLDNDTEKFVIVAELKRTSTNNIDAAGIINAIENAVTGLFAIQLHDIVLTSPLGIPRTTSGKLQRVKCKDSYRKNDFTVIESKVQLSRKLGKKEGNLLLLQAVIHHPDPQAIKNYLLDIIESKTGSLPCDIDNDKTELTDVGIDSLRGVELINIINRDLSINMDAAKIFQDNKLTAMVNVIENMLWLRNKQPFGTEITI